MDDIEFLRTGFFVPLVRPSGGMICLVDISKLPRPMGDAFPRLLMYFSSLFRGQASRSPDGITIIHVVTSAKRVNIELQRNPVELFRKAMHGKRKRAPKIVVAQAYEEGKEHLIDFLGFQLSRTEEFRTNLKAECVAGKSYGETLHLLQEKGLEREFLPRCLGGTYDYKKHDEWIRTRLCIEDIMSAVPIRTNTLRMAPIPVLAKTMEQTAMIVAPEKPAATTRRAVQARRMRSEKKKEESDLEYQRYSLIQRNDCLRVANRKLEAVLAQARLLAATHANGAAATADPNAFGDHCMNFE